MTFPYHGNYVGPGWSAGKFQSSVYDPSVVPVDSFDEAARDHDKAYSLYSSNSDRAKADWDFVRSTKGLGVKAELARSAVALQALARDTYTYMTKTKSQKARAKNAKNGKKGKGAQKGSKAKVRTYSKGGGRTRGVQRIAQADPSMLVANNRVAGTYFRSATSGNTGKAKGCELIGSITVNSSDAQGTIEFNQNIAPQFLSGTRLSIDATRWEKYRYTRAKLLLVSKCGNSTNGSMVAYIERDVAEPLPTPSFDSIQKGIAHFGSQDIPCRKDGQATLMKIPDENPYFTDVNASDQDPEYGQGRAIVLLNSTGATVVTSGSSLTVYDVLWEYDCDFWIPQLTTDSLQFYAAYNSNGSGVSTSVAMGAYTSGGTLPVNVAGNAWSFTARIGCFYKALYAVTGTSVVGAALNGSSNLTTEYSSTANLSATTDNAFKVFKCNANGNATITLTPPTGGSAFLVAYFEIISYGSFDPTNPSITLSKRVVDQENQKKFKSLTDEVNELKDNISFLLRDMSMRKEKDRTYTLSCDFEDNNDAEIASEMRFHRMMSTPNQKRPNRSVE